MALSPRVCDSLCQEGNCITHVCTRSTRDATNFKGRRCCKRLHRKKNSNNLRARELRKISWTVIIKMPSISWYENYDWHLSRRIGSSERNFSRAVCFPPIYKELPLFSNLRSPSGASLLTRARSHWSLLELLTLERFFYGCLRIPSRLRNCVFESHTRDFHRKESDSFIEARTRLRNDVTVLSPGREGKRKRSITILWKFILASLLPVG